jgi:hypothetical protein
MGETSKVEDVVASRGCMQARLIVSVALFVVVGRLRANICLEELKIAFRALGSSPVRL